MTSDIILYFENSWYDDSNGNKTYIKNRIVPLSELKIIWENKDTFGIDTISSKNSLFVDKKTPTENVLDFYKRIIVLPPQQTISIESE